MIYTENRKQKIHYVRCDGSLRNAIEHGRIRLVFICAIMSLSFVAVGFRLVDLCLISFGKSSKHIVAMDNNLPSHMKRADIVDRNGVLLASNLISYSLYANPKIIMDSKEASIGLHKIFPNISYDRLFSLLSSSKGFVWIKRNIHPKDQISVNNLGLPGLYFEKEEKRVYPSANIASHLLGFVGQNGEGLSGVEMEFNELLLTNYNAKEQKELQLSIDLRVQDIMHRALLEKYKEHHAKGAAGIVMDVNTGEVISMVSLPDFDPNFPSKVDVSSTYNNATKSLYEMGSTFKSFTIAMALDNDIVTLKDSYDATKPIKIAGHTIHDHHGENRVLSVPEIFMHSSNIGSAKISEDIGEKIQREFLGKIGLLDELLLEIPETSVPMYPDRWGKVSTMTVSFGHGISVTTMHVASAISSLVNGGVFRNPTLVKGNGEKDGIRVIKKETSDIMRKLMHLVVTNGTGKKADVKGYLVGGKTGTAEKAGRKGYNKKKLVSSFVGVFPMNNPKYLVMALMDEPKGIKKTYGYATAGYTAAPVVKKVIEQIGPLLGIKPVDENSSEVKKEMYVDYKIHNDNFKVKKIASF